MPLGGLPLLPSLKTFAMTIYCIYIYIDIYGAGWIDMTKL